MENAQIKKGRPKSTNECLSELAEPLIIIWFKYSASSDRWLMRQPFYFIGKLKN